MPAWRARAGPEPVLGAGERADRADLGGVAGEVGLERLVLVDRHLLERAALEQLIRVAPQKPGVRQPLADDSGGNIVNVAVARAGDARGDRSALGAIDRVVEGALHA